MREINKGDMLSQKDKEFKELAEEDYRHHAVQQGFEHPEEKRIVGKQGRNKTEVDTLESGPLSTEQKSTFNQS